MDTIGTERFTGRVAFVTGAASGIGRAAALAFARAGASVVVADVSEQGNQETARMIEQQGGRALAVQCDVRRSKDVKAALDKALAAFGRLDVAFNNAGIEPKKPAPTADYDEEEWNRIIDIDLRGVFLCMKHPEFTADFLKRHQDKLLFGSDCSCSDGHGGGVSQANNPAAARLAGKCVARETLTVLKRSASHDIFQKVVWDNVHKLLQIPA